MTSDDTERREKKRQAMAAWQAAHPDGKMSDEEKAAFKAELKAWAAEVQKAVDAGKRRQMDAAKSAGAKGPVDVVFLKRTAQAPREVGHSARSNVKRKIPRLIQKIHSYSSKALAMTRSNSGAFLSRLSRRSSTGFRPRQEVSSFQTLPR